MPLYTTPIDPHLRRWMVFIDGENLAIQGQEFAQANGVSLKEGDYYSKDTFLWFPDTSPVREHASIYASRVQSDAVRAYYYTSKVGADPAIMAVREALRKIGFYPVVFKKTKGAKAKGVDITLTKDFLSHGYQNHYDVAVLMSGDGDYVPVVQEVQRQGKIVHVDFIPGKAMSPELRLAADMFTDITPLFDKWK